MCRCWFPVCTRQLLTHIAYSMSTCTMLWCCPRGAPVSRPCGPVWLTAGVPVCCSQFGAQEPGSNSDIKSFAKKTYGVTFPLMSKVDVNGQGGEPSNCSCNGTKAAAACCALARACAGPVQGLEVTSTDCAAPCGAYLCPACNFMQRFEPTEPLALFPAVFCVSCS